VTRRTGSRAVFARLAPLLFFLPGAAFGWGFDAHRIITESAARALPEPLGLFYVSRLRSASNASIEPDSLLKRRDGDAEDRNHYLDLDELSRPPFEDIPETLEAAKARFGKKRIEESGVLPWRAADVHDQLVAAFSRQEWKEVVRLSGWLSHYVGDAFQPLHTTRNHDGQLTGNQGIHAAFETDLIVRAKERYRQRATLPVSFAPRMIDAPGPFLLGEMRSAHARVADVLKADSAAMLRVKKQRDDYFEALEEEAGELAGSRMREAAAAVASLWHSAWVKAGSPALPPVPADRAGRGVRGATP